MWAFMCGAVSSGVPLLENLWVVGLGIVLAGPLVCAMSQAINDWHDRHVDAINEPHRPIPSGRVPGRWGLYIALLWSLLSLLVAAYLGTMAFAATLFGLFLAWAYSAPPLRLKLNGWTGNAACAICYEGLAWFTGAAILMGALPDWRILALAGLYSFGAHGIMTLNDFKALEGDRATGVRSLPVVVGPEVAAKIACTVMALPQMIVISLLFIWGRPVFAAVVLASLLAQFWAMRVMMRDPKAKAPWYNATGVTLYVSGMMVTAFAIRTLELAP